MVTLLSSNELLSKVIKKGIPISSQEAYFLPILQDLLLYSVKIFSSRKLFNIKKICLSNSILYIT